MILNSNASVAEEYSEILIELKEKGKPIPENDIWIASICRNNGLILATRDKHLTNVNNLNIEIWK
ncbi:MAG: PIN domain-containing protein [Bacteroidales bacterium]|nr:PIN domain-containing protein [Bacteroidales bacterium]